MPADASIYSLIRPLQQQAGPMDQYTQGMQLRHLMDSSDLAQLKRKKLADDMAKEERFSSLFAGVNDPNQVDQGKLFAVDPARALAFQKSLSDAQKNKGEMIKHDRENLLALQDSARKTLTNIKDDAGMARFRDEAIQRAGLMMSPQMRQHAMSFAMSLPTTFDPNWIRNQVVDPQKLFTPDVKPVDVGGKILFPDQNTFTNPGILTTQLDKTNSPDSVLRAGVDIRGQDAPRIHEGPNGPVWVTPPTAGGPVPAVGGGAPVAAPAPIPASVAPSGSAPRGAVPGANASFMGANPAQATMAAIAKIKAEIAASKDPGLIASLEKEIAGAAKAVGFTPEQVAQIQPARAQLSALDAEQAQTAPQTAPVRAPSGMGADGAPLPARNGTVPVTDQNGKPIGPKQPESAKKELNDLNAQFNTVNKALQYVQETPGAFGMMRGIATTMGSIPEALAMKVSSSENNQARAFIYNVVSKVINERAGAAQSKQELARLRGFLPSEYDDAKVIKDKLDGFKEFLSEQAKAYTPGTPSNFQPAPTGEVAGFKVIGVRNK